MLNFYKVYWFCWNKLFEENLGQKKRPLKKGPLIKLYQIIRMQKLS